MTGRFLTRPRVTALGRLLPYVKDQRAPALLDVVPPRAIQYNIPVRVARSVVHNANAAAPRVAHQRWRFEIGCCFGEFRIHA